jgi:hypothetical protein
MAGRSEEMLCFVLENDQEDNEGQVRIDKRSN